MPPGLHTLTDIKQPKTRNSTALPGYQVTAIAKTADIHTSQVGWAIYRTNESTGDLDWAKDENGRPTDEYIFTGENIHLHDFDE